MAGIGHNGGPKRLGRGWHRHCWEQSPKQLIGKAIPIEVVRTRIKRARELGLEYPQYASILLGSGRDIVGFLFTVNGLQLRLQRRLEMPDQVKSKLQGLKSCQLMSFAPSGEMPEAFRTEVSDVSGVGFAACAQEPERELNWPEARKAVRDILNPFQLPSNAVVMIGTKGTEERMAMAGRMARFIPSEAFFTVAQR